MGTKILVIDDEPDMCELLSLTLAAGGVEVVTTASWSEAFDRMGGEEFDTVLTDLSMKDVGGLEVCERVAAAHPNLPVIVVTGVGSLDAAVAAMRAGAYDFITKPLEPKLLALSVARAIEHKRAHAELRRLRDVVRSPPLDADGMIGSSRAMHRLRDVIGRVGATDVSVLIEGETGAGKEVVARRIHQASERKSGPFIAINCAAMPPTLLESELFGHARGAFTDARTERTGLFLQASGGTLFLDEIGELPLELQPKLLRALQEKTIRPIGTNAEVPYNARVLAASNRDLEEEVAQKRFREDLFYRINVVRVVVPALRDRDRDILELAQHFLEQDALRSGRTALRMSAEVAKRLLDYRWPGNVRELENCIARAVALARYAELTLDDLPDKVRSYESSRFVVSADDEVEVVTLIELERRYVERVLALFHGNKSRAALALGIDRRTIYRKADKWSEARSEDPPRN